jgi:hypothetical protein
MILHPYLFIVVIINSAHVLYVYMADGSVQATDRNFRKETSPEEIARLAGGTVKSRIWIFLSQSMYKDLEDHRELRTYTAPDLLEICKGDLITSKRNRYKNLNIALRELIREGYVVRVPAQDEMRYRFSSSNSLRINISKLMSKEPGPAEERHSLAETERYLRKIYNMSFGENMPADYSMHSSLSDSLPNDISETVALHYRDFVCAALELVELFKRPEMYVTEEERMRNGMLDIRVNLSYLPGKYWNLKKSSGDHS